MIFLSRNPERNTLWGEHDNFPKMAVKNAREVHLKWGYPLRLEIFLWDKELSLLESIPEDMWDQYMEAK